MPSRFLEEVPSQLIESLGGGSPAWSDSGYGGASRFSGARRSGGSSDFADRHYNYEDESQEPFADGEKRPASGGKPGFGRNPSYDSSKPFVASWMTPKAASTTNESSPAGGKMAEPEEHSIDNIARFFGGKSGLVKPGSLVQPVNESAKMNLPAASGATGLKKGQRVFHAKYGEGTVMMREGDGEDAKLTVMFQRHGMKKLIEKFANLRKG
jgi:DNA helicase-2/ATP-dependent DNA helicase PcrA